MTSAAVDRASVSIALATYNGEKYIQAQLDSLAAQTVLPLELVVSDDGSTDKTIEIVESFSVNCPFAVRISQNETTLGFADNFLKAAQMCNGALIAFCDQDDIWSPQKIERCTSVFMDANVAMAIHSAELLVDGKQTGRYDPAIKENSTIPANSGDILKVYPGFAIMFRSEVLKLTDNFVRPTNVNAWGNLPRTLAHDGWIRLLASTFWSVRMISEPLVLYRQHETNTFGARPKPRFHRKIYSAIKMVDYRRRRDSDREFAEFFEKLSNQIDEAMSETAARRAAAFRQRESLFGLRMRIYDQNSSFVERLLAFIRIFFVGGYKPATCADKLGRAAMLKDFFFGVLAVYKLFCPDPSRKLRGK